MLHYAPRMWKGVHTKCSWSADDPQHKSLRLLYSPTTLPTAAPQQRCCSARVQIQSQDRGRPDSSNLIKAQNFKDFKSFWRNRGHPFSSIFIPILLQSVIIYGFPWYCTISFQKFSMIFRYVSHGSYRYLVQNITKRDWRSVPTSFYRLMFSRNRGTPQCYSHLSS